VNIMHLLSHCAVILTLAVIVNANPVPGILVLGGIINNNNTSQRNSSVEFVNLSGSNGSCAENIPDLPEAVAWHGTTSTENGAIFSCGGKNSSKFPTTTDRCYSLSTWASSPRWINATALPKSLHGGSLVSLGNSIVWSGGYDHYHHSHDEIYSRYITSERSGGPWKLVAKMKTRRAFHCSVAYRKNSVVIIGGYSANSSVEEYKRGANTTTLLDSLIVGRHHHSCSYFTSKHGVYSIVVAGGFNMKATVKLSTVERMTRSDTGVWTTWETVASLPAGRSSFAMVTVGYTLYIVGGVTRNSSFEDSVLKSSDGQKWEEADSKLEIGRHSHAAIATENEDGICSGGM